MTPTENIRAFLREYYGKTLSSSADLQTSACCAADAPPAWIRPLLENIHPRVSERFYGCGFPIPAGVEGKTVLDLGCGSGRDVYLLAQLAGPKGRVHGVDMTEAQLAVARETLPWHLDRLQLPEGAVAFHEGYIEDLEPLPIERGSVDVVVSNCVVNLSPRKDLVLAQAARALHTGGELYFSDVFADRRLPEEVASDPVLHAECLGGAMYLPDFVDLAKRSGFPDPRIVSDAPIELTNDALRERAGAARFHSVTLRLFKLPDLEPRCEDYGQLATYRGTLPRVGPVFWLDDHHCFEAGRPERVCGNTADMLTETRFAEHFEVSGSKRVHYGAFDCADTMAATQYRAAGDVSGACC